MGEVVPMTKHGKIISLQKQLDEMAFERNNAVMDLSRMRDSRGMWRFLACAFIGLYVVSLVMLTHGS